jgi:predicted small lipoprotein YifL
VRRRLIAALVLATLAACGSGETTLGPLTLQPPDGWLVTDREATSIKLTNGTIADESTTKAGTATAVFDVYTDSEQTVGQFVKALRKSSVRPRQEALTVDGYDAVIVSYPDSFFGPPSDVLFVPEWRVRAVYRAAFPEDGASYERHRDAFREAVASIRFEGRPPRRA